MEPGDWNKYQRKMQKKKKFVTESISQEFLGFWDDFKVLNTYILYTHLIGRKFRMLMNNVKKPLYSNYNIFSMLGCFS